ncbi:MAG TPA: hypothetical protein VFO94_08275 [Gammaproteobacteria bacterium]|nr:hypothetical protein [Gammaproteobacteria bacterium]
MILAALALSCVIFVEAFLFLELGKQARGILATTKVTVAILTDAQRSDEEKESTARRAAGALLAMTAAVLLKLAAIAAILALFFAGAVRLFPESEAALTAALTSPAAIVLLTVVAGVYVWTRNALLRQI